MHDRLLDGSLTNDQRVRIITDLVAAKRIGRRGHLVIDVFVFILIGIFVSFVTANIWNLSTLGELSDLLSLHSLIALPVLLFNLIGCLLVAVGAGFTIFVFLRYQRKPTESHIEGAVSQVRPQQTPTMPKQGQ